MQQGNELIDTKILQEICDQISGEIDAIVSIFADKGEIIASSRRSRIGAMHPAAEQVMKGEFNFLAMTAQEAAKHPDMMEGYLLPIDIDNQRLFCVSVVAPVEKAQTYCRIIQLWVVAIMRQRKLIWSEQRFRDVAESAGDWIWEMDQDLRFTYISPNIIEILGVLPATVIGKTRFEFAEADLDDSHWQDHEATLTARLPFREFAFSRVKDGKSQHLKISGKPVYDSEGVFWGYRGTGYDNTNQIEMKDALEKSQQLLIDAIDTIPEGFSLYDEQDRLVIFNDRFRDMLYPDSNISIEAGMTFETIVRQAAEGGLVPEAQGRIEDWVKERLHRRRQGREPHIQQRSNERWILVSEHKTRDGGTVALYSDITELKQQEKELSVKSQALERLSSQLAKYLSPQVYESIFSGRNEVKIASQRKKLTVFFSDLSGFTEIADRLESEELTQLLNEYLTEMSQIALEFGATIDKYVGDAIVIFFGDPESKGVKQDALACVKMAIAMRQRLLILNKNWQNNGLDQSLTCRIGINTGYCTVGNFGSEDRMDYTIIGGGVNLASRLETKAHPGQILISYETYALIRDEIECQEFGQLNVKGIAYPVKTFEVIDTYKNSEKSSGMISEDYPNLQLRIDVGSMTSDEKSEVEKLLRRALDQVTNST